MHTSSPFKDMHAKFRRPSGFTLIELLVVILIIAILIAIAAPAFLTQQAKAHNSAAQQTVAVVSKSMKAIYVSEGLDKYPTVSVIQTQLSQGEPQYSFSNVDTSDLPSLLSSTTTSPDPNTVTFSRDNDDQVTVCVKSKTNAVFCQTRNEVGQLLTAASQTDDGTAFAAGIQNGGTILNLTGTNEHAVRCWAPISTLGVQNRDTLAKTPEVCNGGMPTQDKNGNPLTVTVPGADEVTVGWTKTAAGGDAVPEESTPSNTALPAVTGTVAVGETLTGSNGIWLNADSYTYQWQYLDDNDPVAIAGETALTHIVTQSDVGHKLVLEVVAKKGSKTEKASSTPTTVVAATTPQATTLPSVSGQARTRQTITGNKGEWVRAESYDYQWQRLNGADWANISGATSTTYQLTTADLGHELRFQVKATNAIGQSETAFSTATAEVSATAPSNVQIPTITGSQISGQVLTANRGTWDNADTYAYKWQRQVGGVYTDISSATSSTYTLTGADVGTRVRAVVTAYGDGTSFTAEPSTGTGLITAPPTPSEEYSTARLATNPSGFFSLNETTGAVANNSVSGGTNGIYSSDTVLGESGRNASAGTSVRNTGRHSAITIPLSGLGIQPFSSVNDSSKDFTVEANFEVTAANQNGAIIMVGGLQQEENSYGVGIGGGQFENGGSPRPRISALAERVAWYQFNSPVSPTANALPDGWHNISLSRRQQTQTVHVWLDGEKVGEFSSPSLGGQPAPTAIRIGGYAASSGMTNRGFNGRIDDVAVYNRRLSDCELAKNGRLLTNPNYTC